MTPGSMDAAACLIESKRLKACKYEIQAEIMCAMKDRPAKRMLIVSLMLWAGALSHAQGNEIAPSPPEPPEPVERSIEDLNYVGGEEAMPAFSDSIIDVNSEFRQALFRKGMAFRVISGPQYTQNVLDAPVAAHEQVYVGQRPYWTMFVQPILTADLRQLGLRQAQLYMGGVWNRVSWDPAGPSSLQVWDLYFYKAFGEDRVEVKAGYISNNLDFVGLFVGGSTAAGAQGVYAVLPYEAGLSYFPLTTASFNVRIRGPKNTYLKAAAQRSVDPRGGPAEVARNHTGFRFIPHGDKLLLINEGGYLRKASSHANEAWFRAGYMYNMSAYKNAATGQSESGNYCAYALMDYQFRQSDGEHPNHGLYAGGSFITVPETLNAYARYYEARVYLEAPFRSRPHDLLSVVASHTGYSRYFVENFVAGGKTVWRSGTTLSASYSLRTSRGSYLTPGLSYLHGPAITPRVPNALNFTATWNVFF